MFFCVDEVSYGRRFASSIGLEGSICILNDDLVKPSDRVRTHETPFKEAKMAAMLRLGKDDITAAC